MLLEMLTIQVDKKPIYARDLDSVQHQLNIITAEYNAVEAAICLLRTELAESHNVANALA